MPRALGFATRAVHVGQGPDPQTGAVVQVSPGDRISMSASTGTSPPATAADIRPAVCSVWGSGGRS